MPFAGKSAMDAKREFVALARVDGANVSALCRRFGISRQLGWRLLRRHGEEGDAGLGERSRRPRTSPLQTDPSIEAKVMAVRAAHPAWGGRKIARVLENEGLAAPSPSTVSEILKRNGVTLGEHGGGAKAFIRFEREAPNELWQMDFKGQVATLRGRLHPLTVLDDHSRFCITLAACADEQRDTVKAHLTTAFERYGLPAAIITDNGPPWGTGRLARRGGPVWTDLGVWIAEQDISVRRSRPLHPQTMGKDERFHRTLKAEALSGPPFASIDAAAHALAAWRTIYNTRRPHEALKLATPASRHIISPRPYRQAPEPFDYAPDDQLRRVDADGRISYRNRPWRIGRAFSGRTIALRPSNRDGLLHIVFRTTRIADLDLNQPISHPACVTDVPEHLSRMSPV
jgi:transposase InsO family protein